MIDFACKRFDLNEVIRCSLSLTKTEFKILKWLMERKRDQSSYKISKSLRIGLSTSQKAIKNIYQKGLITRRQKNLEKGGYIFVYSVKDKDFLKKRVLEIIHNWVDKVEKEIKRL